MPRGSAWVGLVCAVFGATGVLVAPAPACACDCLPITPREAKAEASIVFVGTVTQRIGKPEDGSPDPVTYVFAVENVVKGASTPTLRVQTNNSSAACGVQFRVGERYEVYAVDADGIPFVTQCGGTHRVVDRGRIAKLSTAGKPPGPAVVTASASRTSEEDPHMPVEGVIAAVGIIGVLLAAIVLVSRSRSRD